MSNVLHVGLPKTGTTFLQRRYFPRLAEYHCITSDQVLPSDFSFIYKINKEFDILPRPTLIRKLIRKDRNLNIKKISSKIQRYKNKTDLPILLSCEGLVGVSFSPLRNNIEVSLLIKSVLDIEKVILVIRRQDHYVQSLYRQLILEEDRYGRFICPEDFVSKTPRLTALSSAVELNWLSLYQNYISIFGLDNVLCLPYEEMVKDLHGFIGRINNFLGVAPRLTQDFFTLRERVSNVQVTYRGDNGKKFQEFDLELLRDVLTTQYANNKLLTELLDRDLSVHGYHF